MGLFEFFKTYFRTRKSLKKKIKNDQLEKCTNLKIFLIYSKKK